MARRLRQPLRPIAAFILKTWRSVLVHRYQVVAWRKKAAAVRVPRTGREGPPLCGEGPRPRLGPLGLSLLKQVTRGARFTGTKPG